MTASKPFDFVGLAAQLEAQYRSYLQTTFHFRDPELRESFNDALSTYELSKGPYIEAIPMFEGAGSGPELAARLLGHSIDPSLAQALGGERELYLHQAAAIEKVRGGRNVVVATGTGSGKTEAFLYPILLQLYQEHLQEHSAGRRNPGVRALILYPMNALANDQRDRLRDIDQRLRNHGSDFAFTFGQYIGDTPESASDSRRDAQTKLQDASPGELVLREQMRDTPPDILLTNYSMLEYLLTRPDDSPLFDSGRGSHWAFFVLDEAHQYRGTKGIEMALLLRRLRWRVRQGGRTGDIRCIATSATLGGGEDDRSQVARFASELFGESFDDEDVIFPVTRSHAFSPLASLTNQKYVDLESKVEAGVLNSPQLGDALVQDQRATDLVERVRTTPVAVSRLAEDLFPEMDTEAAIASTTALIRLLAEATLANDEPLLQARVHVFLRSLEGAFITFSPKPQIILNRNAQEGSGAVFEVALCRECGQLHIAGQERQSRLAEATRDPSNPSFGVTFYRPVETESGRDEDLEDPEDDGHIDVLALCTGCAQVSPMGRELQATDDCTHKDILAIERLPVASEPDQAKRCRTCGFSGQDPIGEVVHGTDGPNAVLATTLFREMEAKHRKVLAFADGRQQAAFFAWYLQDSYETLLARNLIQKTAKEVCDFGGTASLGELAVGLESRLLRAGTLRESSGATERRREAWRQLYREFLADQRRISLEGVGLIEWAVQWPSDFSLPKVLMQPPWSLAQDDAMHLMSALFETLRIRRAVSLAVDKGITLDFTDLDLRAAQVSAQIGVPERRKGVIAWDGPGTHRADLLGRLAAKLSLDLTAEQVGDTLRKIWADVADYDRYADDALLITTDTGTRRLNPNWWRAAIPEGRYVCTTCRRMQGQTPDHICTRFKCPGTTEWTSREWYEANHYRALAEGALPGQMRVEEHTAQLAAAEARRFQKDFKENRIDVLSSSTTFELGVDLGDLDAVFLRNVPPEPFNYAQRVGRAARRPGRPGFAVTYCSRSPHDLFHFSDPLGIVGGKTAAPFLQVTNDRIAIRHVASVALSEFFRTFPERFANVRELFGGLEAPSLAKDLEKYLLANSAALTDSLRNILPPNLQLELNLENRQRWIERVVGVESNLWKAQIELAAEFAGILAFQESAIAQKRFGDAGWAERRRKTLENENVLGFLSRRAVIPKYGFPVDVVGLDTSLASDENRVELDRDLSIAISEFAPGASLIANKRLWTSYAVKHVPDREWKRERYAICKDHGVFQSWLGDKRPTMINSCCDNLSDGEPEYIIPEFGFTTGRMEPPKPPTARPRKQHSTRPYIVTVSTRSGVDATEIPASQPFVRLYQAPKCEMVSLCEGRHGEGFLICSQCGAAVRSRAKRKGSTPHKSPLGAPCEGSPQNVSLAHRFETDAVRIQFLREKPETADATFGFAWSLGYALVEGAAVTTGSPVSDLSVTVTHDAAHSIPPIILYDAVPGGAGLVASLVDSEQLYKVMRHAHLRVAGTCGCADDESCYGCLRNYRNQFVHNDLQRGPVLQFLESTLEWK